MACERFGEFKRVNRTYVGQNAVARHQRKKPRKTGLKKCNCPFRLRITCVDGINWKLWVFKGQHNHSSYETLIVHSFSGRLNPEEKDLCISLSVNGNVSITRTIYNVKSKFKVKVMEGRTNMQLYSSNNLPSVIVTNDDHQLHNAVNLIFPEATRLLCTYHISCNVTSHFEKDIPSNKSEDLENIKQDWETLWRFADHAMYEINLAYFLKTWSMMYPTTVRYLRTQWLARKEQFVYEWTNNILHFGNKTTNQAESEHAALKNFLRCSTGDFLKFINIRASLEKSKTVVVDAYSQSPVTKRLLITVEVSAMGKSRFGGRCLCILRKTHGLPCACEILNNHKNCSPISLDSLHDHWTHLSMVPIHEKVATIFDWEDLFEKIRMKYEACTELQKISC
ncbi:hypothetical protein MKX01_031895 [Papaver californicum]|nr:hypothetical protein MKX01_031895 [Papaver californicum]